MDDRSKRLGTYVVTTTGDERVRAFVPPRLPPEPPVELGPLQSLLEQANQSLGRLDGLASVLPDLSLLIYMYVRKEAVLSSQIEGTQSSLSDLLLFENEEAPGVPLDDVRDVSSYVAALEHGLRRLREGFPLSLRLLREIHQILLSKGRGSAPDRVMECMGALELFLHAETPDTPLLVKAALVHVQFETIHPFLDGNGRLGRLLITFLLCAAGALREPILYLSLFFKAHRQRYYELLDRVRTTGDWETWVEFFLTGVRDTSNQAADTARQILSLVAADRREIEKAGRPAVSMLRVHHLMQANPIVSIPAAAAKLSISAPTVAKSVEHMQRLGIVRELTGKPRHRLFVYHQYLKILNQGTEALPR